MTTTTSPSKAHPFRLRDAIVTLGQQCNTGLRNITDTYLRCISTSTMRREFPRAHRAHGHNARRSLLDGFGNVLIFHIGDALLEYYENLDSDEKHTARLALIEEIAKLGVSECGVWGNDREGYMILSKAVIAKQLERQRKKEEADDALSD